MLENNNQPLKPVVKLGAERIKRICYLIWAIIGVILLIIAAYYVLQQIGTALAIIGFSAFIVFVLRVPVAWMQRHGIRRWIGTIISYLGASLVIAIIMLIFIPLITEQTIGLIQLIPRYVNSASSAFNEFYQEYSYLLENSEIRSLVTSAATELSSWATGMVSQSTIGAINFGVNLVTSLLVLLVSLIVGFWVLTDLPKIGRELRVIMGPKREEEVMFIVSTVSRAFGGYLLGMTISGACVGLIAGIGYWIIGLPFPAVLGLLTGLLNFLPYVGPWTAGIVVAIIGIFVSPFVALLSILITVGAQQFTDNFINPRVMSSTVDLHPAIILVGVIAGGALANIIGLICAIPLLSSVKTIFAHYFEKRTGRKLADEKGAMFRIRTHGRNKDKKVSRVDDLEGVDDLGGVGDAGGVGDIGKSSGVGGVGGIRDVASAKTTADSGIDNKEVKGIKIPSIPLPESFVKRIASVSDRLLSAKPKKDNRE